MILKKVILSNISSYEGYNEFNFSVTDDKNVILIGGKNGAGKTSLFNAIKLGLYGPLNYNYQNAHSQYLGKIKEVINKKAFTKEEVNAFIVIGFEYIEEREKVYYEIKRSWKYVNQKIVESYEVKQNDHILNEEELLYFENFLQTILPPHLFSLFFFDGEELSDIFVGSRFSHYIKEAFLVLCNFDSFELIRKYCQNYVSRNNTSGEAAKLTKEYETIIDSHEHQTKQLDLMKLDLVAAEHELARLHTEKDEINNTFKNQGGLSEEEKQHIQATIKQHEIIKEDTSYLIRGFLEEMHPFLMLRDLAGDIKTQIEKERTYHSQESTAAYLENVDIKASILNTLKEITSINLGTEELTTISSKIQAQLIEDIGAPKDFKLIQNLSRENEGRVTSVIEKVENYDVDSIISAIDTRKKSQQITSELNDKLRSSMPEDVVAEYIQNMERINTLIIKQERTIAQLTHSIETLTEELTALEAERHRLNTLLKDASQGENIYKLTTSMSSMLTEFLEKSSISKINKLREYFMENFTTLFRKKNFIDDIDIDTNFNINVYRKRIFDCDELRKLITNLGEAEFIKFVGPKSLTLLCEYLGLTDGSSVNQIREALNKELFFHRPIDIYERVNLQQLSKGEKQVYVLSLYWALIRLSSHEVPFIIDTPYARIDTEHRENITTEFLPNIGHQVIILSTNEEINETYYNMLKPHIAQEYLLVFDTKEKKTEIRNQYFYEV
ncbi:MAG: DNA sulfur modification protein DndD [Clostridium sp.]|nr:DNA sulfur modification protein DndD [Clostridium sp.]